MKNRHIRAALAAATGVAAAVALLPAGTSAAAAPSPTAARADTSDIALKASAYGSRLRGGEVPAGSGMTAFSVIGCSGKAGVTRHNEVAEVEVPQLGNIAGVKTRVWTRKSQGALHSWSRSSTADIVLAESPLGRLSVKGVTSRSHAWYADGKFHGETDTSIGRIVFTPPVGDPQEIDIPAPGQPVTIPGLATLHLGQSNVVRTARHSSAWAVALRVQLLPTGTELFVARSRAQALSGIKHGRFGGYSAGTEVEALDGVITSGRNPHTIMPCQGTDGEVVDRDDVDVDLGGGLHLEGVSAKQWGKRFPKQSKAWERGSIAGLSLGDGALEIEAVVGKATVTRKAGGKLIRSTKGTRIAAITANGEPQELPLDQVIEIPGVAKLEPKVVERLPAGLKVVALRITLLDGTGAVIDLGVAKVTLRR